MDTSMRCACFRPILAAALLLGPATAIAQPSATPHPSGADDRAATEGPLPKPAPIGGYLPEAHVPDAAPLLGPPPPTGSGTAEGDIATFKATRALQGTARWDLATRDAVFGAAALLQDFSCALGVQLSQANTPTLYHMLSRVVVDADTVEARAKKTFKRPRPFVDHEGPICVAKEPWLAKSYSYPSGHSTFAWTSALLLSEAVPDRATEILARARTYGESRVVCGVHYESDVQAGRIAASAAFSALQAEPEFQRDLHHVRTELASLRSAGGQAPDAKECRVEADAVAHPVW
jgi:acid phosphatase (class A)